jgi:hypothetical protein
MAKHQRLKQSVVIVQPQITGMVANTPLLQGCKAAPPSGGAPEARWSTSAKEPQL